MELPVLSLICIILALAMIIEFSLIKNFPFASIKDYYGMTIERSMEYSIVEIIII